MTSGSISSATPYRFENLALFTRDEVVLWNWYCSIVPGRLDWRAWVAEILGHLLERPTGQQLQLTQGHMVDAQFGEKLLSFGSKQQLVLGRAGDNDIVLPANGWSPGTVDLTQRCWKIGIVEILCCRDTPRIV